MYYKVALKLWWHCIAEQYFYTVHSYIQSRETMSSATKGPQRLCGPSVLQQTVQRGLIIV